MVAYPFAFCSCPLRAKARFRIIRTLPTGEQETVLYCLACMGPALRNTAGISLGPCGGTIAWEPIGEKMEKPSLELLFERILKGLLPGPRREQTPTQARQGEAGPRQEQV